MSFHHVLSSFTCFLINQLLFSPSHSSSRILSLTILSSASGFLVRNDGKSLQINISKSEGKIKSEVEQRNREEEESSWKRLEDMEIKNNCKNGDRKKNICRFFYFSFLFFLCGCYYLFKVQPKNLKKKLRRR